MVLTAHFLHVRKVGCQERDFSIRYYYYYYHYNSYYYYYHHHDYYYCYYSLLGIFYFQLLS